MRSLMITAMLVLAGSTVGRVHPVQETTTDRVARLIGQLGHTEFRKREQASKELDVIGEPALGALRKAANSDADAEVRHRAERIVQAVTGRIRAVAAKKELAKWEGTWEGEAGEKMTFKGDRWTSGTPTFGPVSGKVEVVEVRDKLTLVDLLTEEGETKGARVKAIVRVEGDTFHYCGTYGEVRPTEFKVSAKNVYYALKRAKK